VLPAITKSLEGGGAWLRVTTSPTITVADHVGSVSSATATGRRAAGAAAAVERTADDDSAGEENTDLVKAIKASLNQVQSADEDADLQAALQASLNENAPTRTSGAAVVVVRAGDDADSRNTRKRTHADHDDAEGDLELQQALALSEQKN
jgi:hypothetical protein